MNQPQVTKPSLQLVEPLADADGQDERLSIEWNWLSDRWQHRIATRAHGKLWTLLTSVEANAARGWPPSPPLQQIHVQSVHGEPVAFGLGSAGGAHWSATARFIAEAGCGIRRGLELDIATTGTFDNHSWPPDFKSTYVLGVQCAAVEVHSECEGLVTWSLHTEKRTLCWAIRAHGGRLQYSAAGRQIYLFPTLNAESDRPTARWSYRVGVI